jgi:uroporphyrin-3 C-methyltransferase
LLLALLALLGSGWVGYQQWRDARQSALPVAQADLASLESLRDLERRLNQAQQRLVAIDARQQDEQSVNAVLREQLLELSQRLSLSEQALVDVARQSQPQGTRMELAEAEYLLLAAEHRLLLFSDLEGARTALRLADRALASSGDPLAGAVRGLVAAEQDALAALPRVDGAAVQARLGALFANLEQWPLRNGDSATTTPADTEPAPWYRAWLRLDNYLSIRRVAPDAALDPFLEGWVRQGVRGQVALVRLLLLQQRQAEVPAVLADLRRSLEAFQPDHPQVAGAAVGLDALAREPFNQPLPQIGLALDELRRLRGLRNLGSAAASDAAGSAATDDGAGAAVEATDQTP